MKSSPSYTTSNIISKVYNCVKAPNKLPKCCVCSNQEIERQLQTVQGHNYVYIPDRYVEIYLCNFCQKLDQPKCKHCFNRQPCCNHKERVQFMDYFNSLKKDIIKMVTSVSQTFKQYEDKSMKDLTFPQTSYISPSSINKQLMVYLNDVQYKLKKEIEENIERNQVQLFDVYKEFQREIICRLYPYSPEGIQRYKIDIGENITKSMSLEDCVKFLKNVEQYKANMENMGKQICDKYIQKVNLEYPKILYYKLNEAFRQFLIPKLSFKQALVQTVSSSSQFNTTNNLSINSLQQQIKINKQSSLLSSINSRNGGPNIEQKVEGLQKVIEKNFQTIKRLQQRIKDLEFIVGIEQQRNQEYQFKILELEAKLGKSNMDKSILDNDKSIGIGDRDIYSRVSCNNKVDISRGLKSSKSDPNLLKYGNARDVQTKEQNPIVENKLEELINEEQKPKDQCVVPKKSVQQKPRLRRPSEHKSKPELNSSWLEQVVNELGH